jgi:hypothetical protein
MTSQQQILRLERQQEKDFNQHRVDRCVALFDSAFIGFSSTRHARIAGRAALKKTFLHYLRQSPRLRYRIAQPRVQVLNGCAVASFYWTVQLSPRRAVRGRGSHVLVRQGKTWRIVHEHFSRAH